MDVITAKPSPVDAGKAALRRLYAKRMRRALIQTYLTAHDVVKIGIGAGGSRREGWLSTDYDPPARDIVFLDATKPFPFADASVDYFVAEHMIEHIPLADGLFMLKECLRTLKPGGALRVATPDITRYRAFLNGAVSGEEGQYIRWSNETFGGPLEKSFANSGIVAFNRVVRAWGHQFLYDPATLMELFEVGRASPRSRRARSGRARIRICKMWSSARAGSSTSPIASRQWCSKRASPRSKAVCGALRMSAAQPVAIVIAAYKSENVIARAIASALAQPEAGEVVVV